jgi:hypothetical protein
VRTRENHPVTGARITIDQDLGTQAVSLHGGRQRQFLERVVAAAGSGWPRLRPLPDGGAIPGPLRLPIPSVAGDEARAVGARGAWRPTDGEGRFLIDGLPAGRALLGASHPEFVLDSEAAITLAPGGAVSDVVILMKPGCTVSIRTLNENGYPLRGAEVVAYHSRGDLLRTASTGSDGFVELTGLPGRFEIVASAEDRVPAAARVHARPGKRVDVEIILPPAEKSIHGRAVDERGYGVGGVAITARAVTKGLSQVLTTESAADGTFVLEGAGTGAYHVTAEVGGRMRAQVLNASHYEGLKLVVTGSGGPLQGEDDLGYVTPQMLASATGGPLPEPPPAPLLEPGDGDPGIIAITETEELGDSTMTQYGLTDQLPVTGPPSGKGGLPIKIGGSPGKVIVKSVQPGSRVANAGLKAGDRIVSVDGAKVSNPEQARRAISGPIGTVVMIGVIHKGERVNVVVQRVRVLAGH